MDPRRWGGGEISRTGWGGGGGMDPRRCPLLGRTGGGGGSVLRRADGGGPSWSTPPPRITLGNENTTDVSLRCDDTAGMVVEAGPAPASVRARRCGVGAFIPMRLKNGSSSAIEPRRLGRLLPLTSTSSRVMRVS